MNFVLLNLESYKWLKRLRSRLSVLRAGVLVTLDPHLLSAPVDHSFCAASPCRSGEDDVAWSRRASELSP
jgi:hypothetical protein